MGPLFLALVMCGEGLVKFFESNLKLEFAPILSKRELIIKKWARRPKKKGPPPLKRREQPSAQRSAGRRARARARAKLNLRDKSRMSVLFSRR